MKPIILGTLAAFFFAFTFIFNQSMEINGGSWVWSASLRYFFMLPFLFIIVLVRGNLKEVWIELKHKPLAWIGWSTIGFGIFYSFICFASSFGPGWLVAGTWQLTIISGTLLTPLFYDTNITSEKIQYVRKRIPIKSLSFSILIVMGVFVMQVEFATKFSILDAALCFLPILVASFAYPLGNRKMMELCHGKLDVFQRVLGMTIASLPFWFILSIYGVVSNSLPSSIQVTQSIIVALFSGVFATVLFFAATDLVKDDMQRLGAVEATQSFEVLFALIGEMIFLSAAVPSTMSLFGMTLVVFGMFLHSIYSNKTVSIIKARKAI